MVCQMASSYFLLLFAAPCLFEQKIYVDGAGFTFPVNDGDKFVTQGQAATFTFSYTLDNPQASLALFCGYTGTTPDWVLKKKDRQQSQIEQKYLSRAQRGIDSNNQIGFSLLSVRLSDAGNIGCVMIYDSSTYLVSKTYRLKIYEAPRFGYCLPVIGKFFLTEEQTFNSTCSFYGNPQPTLKCVISGQGSNSIQVPYPAESTSNYTVQNPLLIPGVKRTAKFVKCTAYHTITGSKELQRDIVVYYKASAPRDLKVVKSTEQSITVRWSAPSESGNTNIISYLLEIQIANTFPKNATNVTILGDYTFKNLQPQKDYQISVSAYNLVGKGFSSDVRHKTVPYTPPGTGNRSGNSKTGAIVGGVVGGIVGVVIIVAIAVYLSRRESKGSNKYPSSFVEEAVDYPPSNANMYSKVNKKKVPTSLEEDSTSGYPDVIHQANTNQRPDHPEKKALRAGSYEENPTSPSYESSRKEYV